MNQDEALVRRLYQWYTNCEGHTMEVRWPYFAHKKQHLLSKYEREDFWKTDVYNMVKRTEVYHFKQDQLGALAKVEDNIEYREQRMLLFYELMEAMPTFKWNGTRWEQQYNLGFVITEFRRAFSRYEAILQFRRLGLSTLDESLSTRNIFQMKNDKYISAFIDLQIKNREYPNTDWYDFFMIRYKRVPSHIGFAKYLAKVQAIELAIIQSGGLNDYKLVGYTQCNQDLELTQEFNNI